MRSAGISFKAITGKSALIVSTRGVQDLKCRINEQKMNCYLKVLVAGQDSSIFYYF